MHGINCLQVSALIAHPTELVWAFGPPMIEWGCRKFKRISYPYLSILPKGFEGAVEAPAAKYKLYAVITGASRIATTPPSPFPPNRLLFDNPIPR